MKKEEEQESEGEKIPRKLNEILIERIRKYDIQDTSQLVNGPNDEDTNFSYLGGLINFDGGNDSSSLNNQINNNDIDKMTENDIYLEEYKYNDYNELEDDEEEEIEENEKIINDSPIINKEKISEKIVKKSEVKNDEHNKNNKDPKNIRIILSENFNQYLDKIQKNYNKYSNNHFPKIITNTSNNIKQLVLKNLKEKIYNTKTGEKIIVNENSYITSLAYLKNKDLFYDIPPRYKKLKEEFTLDYNLLEEDINNIQIKSMEFIELNSKVSTSISKVLLFSYYLEKYINDKLEPFNNSINISYEKVIKDKKYIYEIKLKTMENAGNIILKRLKMNNTRKLIMKLKKYIKLKNSMNDLELLFKGKKNTQQIYDLINKCREEIMRVKNINIKEKSNENIINIFEKKLGEFKNKNDTNMSLELSELLDNYFKSFINFRDDMNENKENIDKEKIFAEYEKFGITKFVIEKITSTSDIYNSILSSLYFPSNEEEIEKLSKICEYYIEGNLINKIYIQLKGIFTSLCEQQMEKILSIFREKLIGKQKEKNKEENDKIDKKDIDEKGEKKEKQNDENKINEDIINNNEIFVLICIIISKNKLKEILISFIDVILTKVEKSEIIEKLLKNKIIKEFQDIKVLIQENIKNLIKNQIQMCLTKISLSNYTDIDKFINNYYLILESIKDEIPNYYETENNNNNKLSKIIIKEQKNFIENWTKRNLSKFGNELYKSNQPLKKVPSKYQNIVNVFFSFDIENNCMKNETLITKYPKEKIDLIKESLEEEENNNEEENEPNEELINIKDGDKPELKIKISQISLDIINFSFDIMKMFTLFHKECYANILGNMAVIIISHLNLQTDKVYDTETNSEITQNEISMSYCIYILIQYIYEHIKDNDFFVEIAKNCKQKLIDSYLEITKTINRGIETSKKRIEEILENQCIKASLIKLQQIELPNYTIVSGDVPVKEYALLFVSSLKQIYESMINCYEDAFVKEMMNKALEDFFDKFEEFIFHGQKIEEDSCLRQFKRDMIFLKKNLIFINILDLTDVKNRIDNINKSVLPEYMLKTKKK